MTKALWVLSFAALAALLAQVRFYAPWNPYVPYTGQFLGPVLSGLVLGPRLGLAAMTLYLAAGAVGLPVFADQQAGIGILLGATGGYLGGFVLAAGLTGWLSRRWFAAPGKRHLALLGGDGSFPEGHDGQQVREVGVRERLDRRCVRDSLAPHNRQEGVRPLHDDVSKHPSFVCDRRTRPEPTRTNPRLHHNPLIPTWSPTKTFL